MRFALPSDASSSTPKQAEEEDDDMDLVTSNPPVVDKTLVCLANFVHEQYLESRLLSAPPRCRFESLFALSDLPEPTRPRFQLYPRVADIVQATRDRATNLTKGTNPLSSILPKKHRLQSVADEPEFATPQVLNPDFSRLAKNKTISDKCLGMVSFFKLKRMEGCVKALLKANSFSFWLMSGLLSQLKRDGFIPSDPTLFDCHFFTFVFDLKSKADGFCIVGFYCIKKCRKSYLGHASLPLSAAQKRELLISPGSRSDLFDQELIEKVSVQVKEDSFISSYLSLVKLARFQSQRRGKSSASYGAAGSSHAPSSSTYSSLLDHSQSGSSSSSRKRSSSPGRSGGGKQFKGGRGAAPSPKSNRGFQK